MVPRVGRCDRGGVRSALALRCLRSGGAGVAVIPAIVKQIREFRKPLGSLKEWMRLLIEISAVAILVFASASVYTLIEHPGLRVDPTDKLVFFAKSLTLAGCSDLRSHSARRAGRHAGTAPGPARVVGGRGMCVLFVQILTAILLMVIRPVDPAPLRFHESALCALPGGAAGGPVWRFADARPPEMFRRDLGSPGQAGLEFFRRRQQMEGLRFDRNRSCFVDKYNTCDRQLPHGLWLGVRHSIAILEHEFRAYGLSPYVGGPPYSPGDRGDRCTAAPVLRGFCRDRTGQRSEFHKPT